MAFGIKLKGIKEPGIYDCQIVEIVKGKSKKGDPMLSVNFKQIGTEYGIAGYYVPKHAFMKEKMDFLFQECGLTPGTNADQLLGKKVTLGVDLQKPVMVDDRFLQVDSQG